MRILLLADINSAHTRKWVEALLKHEDLDLALYSLSAPLTDQHKRWRIPVRSLGLDQEVFGGGNLGKLQYLRAVPGLLRFIRDFKPEIVHAHYASSYGLLGYLSNFRPFVLSLWGSDIQDFPSRGKLHKIVLKSVLGGTDAVYSTSKSMQLDLKELFKMDSELIPFGILPERFDRINRSASETLRFGTVKSLEEVYGIDLLIKAFASFVEQNPELNSELNIYGKGSLEDELKHLAKSLKVQQRVHFKGFVDPVKVPEAYADIDVFLALSRRESFGVVVLEASASGIPVIVSEADGFHEVMQDGITGIRVDANDQEQIVAAMQQYTDSELRSKHAQAGQKFVRENFDFRENVNTQIEAYKKVLRY